MYLEKERMEGCGMYLVDGFRVNYLFGLEDLCKKYVKDYFTILELGSNNGVSTELFCKYAKKVIAVDLQKTKKFQNVLEKYKNLTFYQTSFLNFFNNNNIKFDLIYIDGSHEYEDVKEDIKNCLKILKKTGILSGHDYNSKSPGVMRAVDEYFNVIETFDDSSWLVGVNSNDYS